MNIKLKTEKDFLESIQTKIDEAKSYDVSHGAKVPHKLLQNFFLNIAPRLQTLADVEHALLKLYNQNGIETTPIGIKNVVSQYRKKITFAKKSQDKVPDKLRSIKEDVEIYTIEDMLNESKISQEQQRYKDKLVRELKKHFAEFVKLYGKDAKKVIHATAMKMAIEKGLD